MVKYKILISCGGTTKNVYLDTPLFDGEKLDTESGSVDKKFGILMLNGTEDFKLGDYPAEGAKQFIINLPSYINKNGKAFCTHFNYASAAALNSFTLGSWLAFQPSSSMFASASDFNVWLKNQYDAGKPVTIIYTKVTPIKETFEAPEIATVTGKNTLTVGTEVTPAKVEVTSFGEYYSKAEVDRIIDEKVDIKIENKQWKYGDTIANVSGTSTLTDIDFLKYSEVLVMAISNSNTALYTSIFPAYMVNAGVQLQSDY